MLAPPTPIAIGDLRSRGQSVGCAKITCCNVTRSTNVMVIAGTPESGMGKKRGQDSLFEFFRCDKLLPWRDHHELTKRERFTAH